MSARNFEFDLYRLNIVDIEDEYSGTPIKTADQTASVLKRMTKSKFDIEFHGKKATYSWGCRQFDKFLTTEGRVVYRIILAKSIKEQAGDTVTDSGLESAWSAINPPLAVSLALFIFEDHHFVAVEHNGTLISGQTWANAIRIISENSAKTLGLHSFFALAPIPEENSLLQTLSSFMKLYRLRTKIRIPNPDLTRYTKAIFEQLKDSAIREYRQDMRNQQEGLNTYEGSLVHSSVALAQDGYSDGDLTFIGIRSGTKVEKIIVGKTSARGRLSISKEQMRTLSPRDVFKEGLHPLDDLFRVVCRIHPSDEKTNA